jgi:RNA polymerase sigma-70 factor (ECF subfamily)
VFHSKIAAMLEMPIGTVRGRIRLGLEKLRGRRAHVGEVSA